jgi:hypothetical protein
MHFGLEFGEFSFKHCHSGQGIVVFAHKHLVGL